MKAFVHITAHAQMRAREYGMEKPDILRLLRKAVPYHLKGDILALKQLRYGKEVENFRYYLTRHGRERVLFTVKITSTPYTLVTVTKVRKEKDACHLSVVRYHEPV